MALSLSMSRLEAVELPSESNTQTVHLQTAQTGKSIQVNFSVLLPPTQKLNQRAPSSFAVYERNGADWRLAKEFKLAERFSLGDSVDVRENVELQSPDSELTLHATVYHCGKDGTTACFIQSFQGKAARSPAGSPRLDFTVKAAVQDFGRAL